MIRQIRLMNLFDRNYFLSSFITALEHSREMPFADLYDLLVLIVEREVLGLLFELLYPVVYYLLIFMVKHFQRVGFWNIVAYGQSMEIVLWLIDVDLESDQRDDLGGDRLVARVVDDEGLVPEDVPSLLHQVCEFAHFEQIALFNDPRIRITL